MKGILTAVFASMLAGHAVAQSESCWQPIEKEVAAATRGPQVTIVHFWAPWCSNSKAELEKNQWSTFIALNSDVRIIFVTVRSEDDGRALLQASGVGGQKNFTLLVHPNAVKSGEGVIESFMDLPLKWVPSTWIFRDGELRYALNYGEVRFPLLQQLVRDATDPWEHAKPAG